MFQFLNAKMPKMVSGPYSAMAMKEDLFLQPTAKIRRILMYQSKKSQYDVSIQGYTGIGKIPDNS